MKKLFVTFFYVIIFLFACQSGKSDIISKGEIYTEGKITWKYGIAFIDGKAKYIDPQKLDQSEMTASISMIEKYKKDNKEEITAGKLIWSITSGNQVLVFNTTVENPYYEILSSEKIYYIKIQNNKTYISENKQKWEELVVEVIRDKPKYSNDNEEPPVYMIIHLKCIYFEGAYEIIGTTG